MQRSTIVVTVSVALASAAIAAGACSFPTIIVVGDPSGSGGGAASSTTGAPTGTGGATVTSSSEASSSESSSTSSSSASSSSASSSSSGGPCTLDVDGDQIPSWMCGGPDCADSDVRAFPDAGFQTTAIIGPERDGLSFDFNCDKTEQAQIPKCALGCDPTLPAFATDVPCGVKAPIGTCLVAVCSWMGANPAKMVQQPCK